MTRLYYGEGTARRVRMRTFDVSVPSWSAEVHRAADRLDRPLRRHEIASQQRRGSQWRRRGQRHVHGARSPRPARPGRACSRRRRSRPANSGKRGFDVAFEALSGDILVVYSNNTPTPVYRARSGGTWSAETALPLNDGVGPNPDPNTGIVHWIELASRPGSNEIALGYSDANNDLVVIVWNGTQWLTATAVALETTLTTFTPTTVVENRCFDLAYESLSGDLMAAWGSSTLNGFTSAIRPAASSTPPPRSPAPLVNHRAASPPSGTDRTRSRLPESSEAFVPSAPGSPPERQKVVNSGSTFINLIDQHGSGDSSDIACRPAASRSASTRILHRDADWARTAARGWVVQTDRDDGEELHDQVKFSPTARPIASSSFSRRGERLYVGTYDGTTGRSRGRAETSLSSISARSVRCSRIRSGRGCRVHVGHQHDLPPRRTGAACPVPALA